MSRKDYIALAAAIAAAQTDPAPAMDGYVGDPYEEGRVVTARLIADALQADNPNFDRQRFYAAALV